MILCALLLVAAPQGERAAGLLSYVAGDYASAVSADGRVVSAQELSEQELFLREAASDLRASGEVRLAQQALQLGERVGRHEAPSNVVPLAQALTTQVEARFQLRLLPPRAPRPAKALYLQACAACHGADGVPARRDLSTLPPDLSSKEAVARLSPRRVFAAVTYGVPGTAMPSFEEAWTAAERWDVAWYVLSLSHARPSEVQRGRELLSKLPKKPDYLQLAVRSDDQLRQALARSPLTPEDREAILSACRAP